MENKLLLLILVSLLQSCSVTYIHSEKHSCTHGDGNSTSISGSHLKHNTMNQSAEGEAEIPVIP
jgi:hypothetical protein